MTRPVAICGGGHLGHAIAAVAGAAGRPVRVLTRNPAAWRDELRLTFEDLLLVGKVDRVDDDPAAILPDAEIVFVEMPAFAQAEVLARIAPFLDDETWIGALPGAGGFDLRAREALAGHRRVFGSARTPYICRTTEYGASVHVSGIDRTLRVAALDASDAPAIARLLEDVLGIHAFALSRYEAVNLTPSNPLVHTARLFTYFTGEGGGAFYRDWNDAASRLLLACDDEIDAARRALEIDEREVPPVRTHYGVSTAAELTRRIRGLAPLLAADLVLHEDMHEHRYVREDFDYGLATMAAIARACGAPVPSIDAMLAWRAAARDAPRMLAAQAR